MHENDYLLKALSACEASGGAGDTAHTAKTFIHLRPFSKACRACWIGHTQHKNVALSIAISCQEPAGTLLFSVSQWPNNNRNLLCNRSFNVLPIAGRHCKERFSLDLPGKRLNKFTKEETS